MAAATFRELISAQRQPWAGRHWLPLKGEIQLNEAADVSSRLPLFTAAQQRGRGYCGSHALKIMEEHVHKYVIGNYSERSTRDHDASRCVEVPAGRLVLIKKQQQL